jgi:hypothetical protein
MKNHDKKLLKDQLDKLDWHDLLRYQHIVDDVVQKRREKIVDERYKKYGDY